tara:strand:- start:121 stop:825 length:705 start_codon:yes stop_codon:yes gene_type:complete
MLKCVLATVLITMTLPVFAEVDLEDHEYVERQKKEFEARARVKDKERLERLADRLGRNQTDPDRIAESKLWRENTLKANPDAKDVFVIYHEDGSVEVSIEYKEDRKAKTQPVEETLAEFKRLKDREAFHLARLMKKEYRKHDTKDPLVYTDDEIRNLITSESEKSPGISAEKAAEKIAKTLVKENKKRIKKLESDPITKKELEEYRELMDQGSQWSCDKQPYPSVSIAVSAFTM